MVLDGVVRPAPARRPHTDRGRMVHTGATTLPTTRPIVRRLTATHRPGRRFAISAQRLPSSLCAWTMMASSSGVQGSLRMAGFKWLCHLCMHQHHGTHVTTHAQTPRHRLPCTTRPHQRSPLATLLAHAPRQLVGDDRPLLRPKLRNQLPHLIILLHGEQCRAPRRTHAAGRRAYRA